jgi:hypothetical protein
LFYTCLFLLTIFRRVYFRYVIRYRQNHYRLVNCHVEVVDSRGMEMGAPVEVWAEVEVYMFSSHRSGLALRPVYRFLHFFCRILE